MKKRMTVMLSALLATCILLSGCMAEDISITFKENGSGTATVGVYFSEDALEEMGVSIDEVLASMEGTKSTKKIKSKVYVGVVETLEFDGIDDLNELLGGSAIEEEAGAAGIRATKSVKDNKEIITITGVVQSDSAIVQNGESTIQLDIADETLEDLQGALRLELSFTFPDGVTGVKGLSKGKYSLSDNTISFVIESGSEVKSFEITGALRDATYQRFPVVNKYSYQFKDVPNDAWYSEELAKTYGIGIITGTSATTFSPNDYLTLAQVTVMAARVRSIYDADGAQFKKANESDVWYKPYLDYAIKKGIINNSKEFSDYDRPATRAEMVHIFAKSLPSDAFKAINGPKIFTDLETSHKYYSDIITMYSAGVIMGTSETEFSPNSNVTRAQAAVIVARVADIGDKVPRE